MNTVEQIGLIITIVLVALILIVVLVALVLILRILSSFKNISSKAERTSESLADIALMVSKRVAPVALSTAVAAAFRRLRKNK
jgi:Na+-transporting methylmalonyl-CoA/oxaloacetate decarboxylase gamma subunit